jgi:hypothetical protein
MSKRLGRVPAIGLALLFAIGGVAAAAAYAGDTLAERHATAVVATKSLRTPPTAHVAIKSRSNRELCASSVFALPARTTAADVARSRALGANAIVSLRPGSPLPPCGRAPPAASTSKAIQAH